MRSSRFYPRLLAASLGWIVLGAAACATTPEGPTPKLRSGKYRIDASDQLEIRVLPEPIIEREVVVRPDGYITMDLIGDVLVQGKTTDEVAGIIREAIARFRIDPSVSVVVAQPDSQELVVSGEVNTPGTIPAIRGLRVSDAIGRAGDVTQLGAIQRIQIIRSVGDHSEVYYTDLEAIRNGDDTTDHLLIAGDIIWVPPAKTVSAGYAIRRALFPIESLFGTLFGVLGSALIGGI